jgi:hypothetical protein
MKQDTNTPASGGGSTQSSNALQASLIDVLLRGLETARQAAPGDDPAQPREFCAFAYGTPGTFCPLLYWHRPE